MNWQEREVGQLQAQAAQQQVEAERQQKEVA